jgi:hypothetical protein
MIYIFLFAILFSIIIGLAVHAIMEAINRNKIKKMMKSKMIIGNCINTRWGCCPDNLIPKYDQMGTNCIPIQKLNLKTEKILEESFDKINLSRNS